MEERNCLTLMKKVANTFRKEFDNALRQRNMTLSQIEALMIMREKMGGSCELKSLERELGIAQSSAAVLTARLEAKGLVEGYSDPDDRRIKRIRLTREGEKVCGRVEEMVGSVRDRALRGISPDEKRLLRDILSRVYSNIAGTGLQEGGGVDA